MNDFSEVQHGEKCFQESWSDKSVGGQLKALLEHLKPGLSKELKIRFDGLREHRDVQSYLVSLSEHGVGTLDEDKYGRLSMWRAYGGDTNVAFVFNNKPFISESPALNAFISPVLYCDTERFMQHFAELIEGLKSNLDLLKQVGPEIVVSKLTTAFHFATLSAKHPGFAEEREWRVIVSPNTAPFGQNWF